MDFPTVTLAMTAKLKIMIKALIPVIDDDPFGNRPTEVYRLVLNDLRKNCMRLQAITVLCEMEKMGDSALGLMDMFRTFQDEGEVFKSVCEIIR